MNKTENSAPDYCTIPRFPSTARASWREPRREKLYHLEEDPDELYNLYDDPARAGAMVERMMDWGGKTRMQRLKKYAIYTSG